MSPQARSKLSPAQHGLQTVRPRISRCVRESTLFQCIGFPGCTYILLYSDRCILASWLGRGCIGYFSQLLTTLRVWRSPLRSHVTPHLQCMFAHHPPRAWPAWSCCNSGQCLNVQPTSITDETGLTRNHAWNPWPRHLPPTVPRCRGCTMHVSAPRELHCP